MEVSMQRDGKRVILRQRVRCSVRAVRNTQVFQTETRVVADVPMHLLQDGQSHHGSMQQAETRSEQKWQFWWK
jgi:hypothetical protein